MLLAIPVDADEGLHSPVCGHFGRTAFYALVDSESLECRVVPNGSSHGGGSLLPPEWLKEQGVGALLCAGVGGQAIALCEQYGVAVYLGNEPTAGQFVAAYRAGTLQSAAAEDGCARHAEHTGPGSGATV